MDIEAPLLERRAKREAKGQRKAVCEEYGDEDVEREADDGVASPIRDSFVPERVDDENARETSVATSLDTELALLERKARKEEEEGTQRAVRKDESSDAGFVIVSGEEDAKGETSDEFVGPVRDSIVPELVYHDEKDEDATSEPASPDSELPLLEKKARREAKEKGKSVS